MTYKVRYDIFICIILTALVVLGVTQLLPSFYTMLYDNYTKKHTVSDGEIGGKAPEDVFRAQNVEDLLSHDTFTVEVEYGSYATADVGAFDKKVLMNLELPSGERVAALSNFYSEQLINDGYTYLMPVGAVVYADLSQDTDFLDRIEHNHELSRTDFYLDMKGNGASVSVNVDSYDEKYTIYIQFALSILSFCIFHTIGSKIGLFPKFFRSKKNKAQQ